MSGAVAVDQAEGAEAADPRDSADVFAESGSLEADLQLQELLLWSRSALTARLLRASRSEDAALAETLRIESMYQFAEFFYLMRARRIETAEAIRNLAEIHNDHLVALTRDADKMRRLGLRRDRLLDAIFTADTLPRLVETWRERPGQIDQSNLARFLVTVMSTETCRKLAVAAAEAGFLERRRSPFGTVLLATSGVMEQVFGTMLRDLRLRIARIGAEA